MSDRAGRDGGDQQVLAGLAEAKRGELLEVTDVVHDAAQSAAGEREANCGRGDLAAVVRGELVRLNHDADGG